MAPLFGSDEPVALDLVAGTAAKRRTEQAGRSADLTCDLASASSYVRRDLLLKIVDELVDNAFKFSEAGTPVRVSTACQGGRTTLTVSDRGEGMPPEKHAVEFDHGFVPTVQGVGLWLAVVRRVVDMAGGEVVVATELDGGTTIVVSLPGHQTVQDARELDAWVRPAVRPGRGRLPRPETLEMSLDDSLMRLLRPSTRCGVARRKAQWGKGGFDAEHSYSGDHASLGRHGGDLRRCAGRTGPRPRPRRVLHR